MQGDPQTAEALAEAVDLMHIALGHTRLYGLEHNITQRAAEKCFARIERVLELAPHFELRSGLDGLSWRGTNLRAEDENKSGIGRLLHREGIIALAFDRELRAEQLVRLLSVLRANLSLPEYEEYTLEALLWEADLAGIEFRAVATLMEAEGLSGKQARTAVGVAEQTMQRLAELLAPEHAPAGNVRQRFTELQLRQAVEQVGLQPPDGLEAEQLTGDEAPWRRLFTRKGSADHEAVAALRAELDRMGHADMLAELALLLMRVAAAGRPELPGRPALELAARVIEGMYEIGAPSALIRLLEDGPQIVGKVAHGKGAEAAVLRSFLQHAIAPARLARALTAGGTAAAATNTTLRRYVAALDDEALALLLKSALDPDQPERMQAVVELLAGSVGARLAGWVDRVGALDPDVLATLIHFLRFVRSEPGRALRRQLLEHYSTSVVRAVLAWYADDLPAEDSVAVAEQLLAVSRLVRQAALAALVARRPTPAKVWLEEFLGGDAYLALQPPHQVELCIAFAKVGGPYAATRLEKLVFKKSSLLGGKPTRRDFEPAAFGLAAVGTERARAALHKGAAGWNQARKVACLNALEALERGKRW